MASKGRASDGQQAPCGQLVTFKGNNTLRGSESHCFYLLFPTLTLPPTLESNPSRLLLGFAPSLTAICISVPLSLSMTSCLQTYKDLFYPETTKQPPRNETLHPSDLPCFPSYCPALPSPLTAHTLFKCFPPQVTQ